MRITSRANKFACMCSNSLFYPSKRVERYSVKDQEVSTSAMSFICPNGFSDIEPDFEFCGKKIYSPKVETRYPSTCLDIYKQKLNRHIQDVIVKFNEDARCQCGRLKTERFPSLSFTEKYLQYKFVFAKNIPISQCGVIEICSKNGRTCWLRFCEFENVNTSMQHWNLSNSEITPQNNEDKNEVIIDIDADSKSIHSSQASSQETLTEANVNNNNYQDTMLETTRVVSDALDSNDKSMARSNSLMVAIDEHILKKLVDYGANIPSDVDDGDPKFWEILIRMYCWSFYNYHEDHCICGSDEQPVSDHVTVQQEIRKLHFPKAKSYIENNNFTLRVCYQKNPMRCLKKYKKNLETTIQIARDSKLFLICKNYSSIHQPILRIFFEQLNNLNVCCCRDENEKNYYEAYGAYRLIRYCLDPNVNDMHTEEYLITYKDLKLAMCSASCATTTFHEDLQKEIMNHTVPKFANIIVPETESILSIKELMAAERRAKGRVKINEKVFLKKYAPNFFIVGDHLIPKYMVTDKSPEVVLDLLMSTETRNMHSESTTHLEHFLNSSIIEPIRIKPLLRKVENFMAEQNLIDCDDGDRTLIVFMNKLKSRQHNETNKILDKMNLGFRFFTYGKDKGSVTYLIPTHDNFNKTLTFMCNKFNTSTKIETDLDQLPRFMVDIERLRKWECTKCKFKLGFHHIKKISTSGFDAAVDLNCPLCDTETKQHTTKIARHNSSPLTHEYFLAMELSGLPRSTVNNFFLLMNFKPSVYYDNKRWKELHPEMTRRLVRLSTKKWLDIATKGGKLLSLQYRVVLDICSFA